jgi:hypothetical protein
MACLLRFLSARLEQNVWPADSIPESTGGEVPCNRFGHGRIAIGSWGLLYILYMGINSSQPPGDLSTADPACPSMLTMFTTFTGRIVMLAIGVVKMPSMPSALLVNAMLEMIRQWRRGGHTYIRGDFLLGFSLTIRLHNSHLGESHPLLHP